MGNYSTSRGVRIWRILAQVITSDFAASRSVPYMTYIAHVVTGVWCGKVMPVCILFLSSRSGIVFNPSAGAITDHSQSAKDTYFKSQLYAEDPGHQTPVLILPNGMSKLGE